MKKKLLIASIYTPVSYNNNWLDTQLNFFNLTTKNYDFGIYCNGIDPKYFDNDAIIIGHQNQETIDQHLENNDYQPDDEKLDKWYSLYHYDIRIAYFKIMDYFRDHADEYENFLLIDCDIFPVHPQWQEKLTAKMEVAERWYAALLREELFETYPWLGVFYIRGEYIHEDIPDWFPRDYINSWGDKYKEFGTTRNKTHHDGECIWYPLVRSNVTNFHPTRFGIYDHFFYHHMKGSWNKKDVRLKADMTKYSIPELRGYYDHYMPREIHPLIADYCHEKLMKEPEEFICELMGVNPNEWFKGEI
jgi:hypothetical protein